MSNIKIFRANRGEGKTKWLAERIKECSETGGNLYYVGGQTIFESVKMVYEIMYNEWCPLKYEEVFYPTSDDSCFTDELIDNLYTVVKHKSSIIESGCNWYITMSKEDFVD